MTPLHSPNKNRLIAALPTEEFELFAEHLELVPMLLGDMVYEPGRQLEHVYFPTTSIVSLHYVTESGASAEIAGVGNEGVVGISLFMGGDTTPSSAVVQTAGQAYRLERRLLMEEFNRDSSIRSLLLRYTQALITQMAQTAICNRYHSVEQQLCRWLLVTLDRVPSGQFVMTQELVEHARRAPGGHYAVRRQIAGIRFHSLPPRPHCGARSVRTRDPYLRMLRGGQEGIEPPSDRRAAPPGHFSCVQIIATGLASVVSIGNSSRGERSGRKSAAGMRV